MKGGSRVLVITGVPCTGKTTLSERLARGLKHAEVIHTTDLINQKKLFSSYASDGSKIVKMRELKAELEKAVRSSKSKIVIIEGHILCDLSIKGARAVVLREHLGMLERRLKARGYSREKIRDNIVSEATDYCGSHAAEHYREVYELLSRAPGVIKDLALIAEGKKKGSRGRIDLLEELRPVIEKDPGLAI